MTGDAPGSARMQCSRYSGRCRIQIVAYSAPVSGPLTETDYSSERIVAHPGLDCYTATDAAAMETEWRRLVRPSVAFTPTRRSFNRMLTKSTEHAQPEKRSRHYSDVTVCVSVGQLLSSIFTIVCETRDPNQNQDQELDKH